MSLYEKLYTKCYMYFYICNIFYMFFFLTVNQRLSWRLKLQILLTYSFRILNVRSLLASQRLSIPLWSYCSLIRLWHQNWEIVQIFATVLWLGILRKLIENFFIFFSKSIYSITQHCLFFESAYVIKYVFYVVKYYALYIEIN